MCGIVIIIIHLLYSNLTHFSDETVKRRLFIVRMRNIISVLTLFVVVLISSSLSTDDVDSCTAILRYYSTTNAIDLKMNYVEYAWFQISTDERLNFINTISLKHGEDPDTFAMVRLARIQEDMELPPGYLPCIQELMAKRPEELWNAMTESEQEMLINEIESALDDIPSH